jgi:hypothetical protein
VRGLLVPADTSRPCLVENLALTAVALSDAIGGGLLEEGVHGQINGVTFCVYVDEDRVAKKLRPNERAAVLSARLGETGRSWLADLRGDVLILGSDEQLDDVDVPAAVVEMARRAGLMAATV